MSGAISIKQKQLQSSSFTFVRKESLSYFIDLHQALINCPSVQNKLQRCKYCRSYPFTISQPFNPIQVKQCQLCNSINDYPMRWQLYRSNQQGSLKDSYIMPSSNDCNKQLTLILYIESLQEQYVNLLVQALKSILPQLQLQTAIIIPYRGRLAIIDFGYQQPEIIIVSKDIDISELIQQKKCIMNLQSVQQLEIVLLALQKQVSSNVNQSNSLTLLSQIVPYFNDKSSKTINTIVWIGKFPSSIAQVPQNTLRIIPILIIDDKIDQAKSLIQLRHKFCQIHYLHGNQLPVQLYYKLYEVLNKQHLGYIVESILTLKTDQKYSGHLLGVPTVLINESTPLLEIGTNSIQKHKLQVHFETYNLQGNKLKVALNHVQKSREKMIWFERVVLISRALSSVLKAFFQLPAKQRNLDFYFIRVELQRFAGEFQNKTSYYEQIIHHVTNYFKDFQKSPFKIYLPFSLLFKKQLLFVFYPLSQGGMVYYFDGLWVDEQGQDNLDWLNQTMGVVWTPKDKKLPIYYQICLNKEAQSFIQCQ